MGTLICTDCANRVSDRLTACPHCGGPMAGAGNGVRLEAFQSVVPDLNTRNYVRVEAIKRPRAWRHLLVMVAVALCFFYWQIGTIYGLGSATQHGQVFGCAILPILVGAIAVTSRATPRAAWCWFLVVAFLVAIGTWNMRPYPKRDMALNDEARAMASMAREALKEPDKDVPLASLPSLTSSESSSLDSLSNPQTDAELARFMRLTYQRVIGEGARKVQAIEVELATLPLDRVLLPENLVSHERIAWGRNQVDQAFGLIDRRNSIALAANRELDTQLEAKIPTTGDFGSDFWTTFRPAKAKRDDLIKRVITNQQALKGEFVGLLTMMDDLVGQSSVENGQIMFADQAMVDDYNRYLARLDALVQEEARLQEESQEAMRKALNTMASMAPGSR